MEYEIYGTAKLDMAFDIEANSEEEAIALATEQLKEYHRFEDVNIYNYEIKLGADEIIYDDGE